jgi:hypothetical protein
VVTVDWTPASAGAWDSAAPGWIRWSLAVEVPGAPFLYVGVDLRDAPADAVLRVRAESGREPVLQLTPQKQRGSLLWTRPLAGSRLTLDLTVPDGVQGAGTALAVRRLGIGLSGGASGAGLLPVEECPGCMRDVACPEADGWGDQIRSVGMLLVLPLGRGCSGTLVNNTNEDLDPLFLTARHCVTAPGEGICGELMGAEDFDGINVRWKYQADTCCAASVDTPSVWQDGGADLLAEDSGDDIALLRLRSPPPPEAEAYWAGWDRSGEVPGGVTAIHHGVNRLVDDPARKWISVGTSVSTDWQFSCSVGGLWWLVDEWEHGSVWYGSSGSGFFASESQQVIGVQSHIRCGPPSSPGCLDEDGDHGWDGTPCNTATTSAGRLEDAWDVVQPFLDPAQTGVASLPGLDACPHGACEQGGPLDPACGACEAAVCSADSYCCDVAWDSICVQEAEDLCGVDCGGGCGGASCPDFDQAHGEPTFSYQSTPGAIDEDCWRLHWFAATPGASYRFTFCEGGGTASFDTVLESSSAMCFPGPSSDDACGLRSQIDVTATGPYVYVRVRGWGGAGGSYALAYRKTADPGDPCPHGVCEPGEPLDWACGACEAAVCNDDPYCCDVAWDSICVEEAEDLCGADCGGDCAGSTCPAFDQAHGEPAFSYQTTSGAIAEDCWRLHRFATTPGASYRFTFCEGGGTANFDTVLEITSATCFPGPANDDACGLRSQITVTATGPYVYVRVRGWGGAGGSYTLAYRRL